MTAPTAAKLTCSHDGCGCQVEITTPCACQGTGQYTCHCGADMVPSTG